MGCWVSGLLCDYVYHWITGKGQHLVSMLLPPHHRTSESHRVKSKHADNWIEFLGSEGAGSPALIYSTIFYLLYICSSCLLGGNASKSWHLWRKGRANRLWLKSQAFLCISLGPSTINQLLHVCAVDACICLLCFSSGKPTGLLSFMTYLPHPHKVLNTTFHSIVHVCVLAVWEWRIWQDRLSQFSLRGI